MKLFRNVLKFPRSEFNDSPSAVVPREDVKNEVIDAQPKDFGLKPNNITIEDMRGNISLYDPHLTDLDRAAIAVRESAANAKEIINSLKDSQ